MSDKKRYRVKPGDNPNTIIEDMQGDGYNAHELYLESGTILTGPIKLIDNLSVTFHDTILMGKRGEYPGHPTKPWRGACVLDSGVEGVKNLRLSGKGKVSMERVWIDPDNFGRHCLNLEGCENVYINGIEFAHGRGDCIMFGTNKPCKNILVKNVKCKGAQRNCISITNAIDLTLCNVECVGAKANGVDIEPEVGNFAQGLRFYDLLSWYNGADGMQIDCGKSSNYWYIYINRYASKGNKGRHLSTNNFHPMVRPPGTLVIKSERRS